MRRPRRRHPAPGGAARHAGVRCGGPGRRLPGARRGRPARLSRLLLRRPHLRPGSARQRRQRPAPAGPASPRAVGPGDGLVQPGAAGDPARHRPGLDGGVGRRWRSIVSPSKTSTGSRRTSSMRRGSGSWRCRRSSAMPPTTATTRSPPPTPSSRRSRSRPARRCRPPTPATGPSSPPTASRRIAPRPSRPTTSRSPITRTPMPRSTTACCSATGSIPRRAATRRCSRRRSTATRSRPRWSRT